MSAEQSKIDLKPFLKDIVSATKNRTNSIYVSKIDNTFKNIVQQNKELRSIIIESVKAVYQLTQFYGYISMSNIYYICLNKTKPFAIKFYNEQKNEIQYKLPLFAALELLPSRLKLENFPDKIASEAEEKINTIIDYCMLLYTRKSE